MKAFNVVSRGSQRRKNTEKTSTILKVNSYSTTHPPTPTPHLCSIYKKLVIQILNIFFGHFHTFIQWGSGQVSLRLCLIYHNPSSSLLHYTSQLWWWRTLTEAQTVTSCKSNHNFNQSSTTTASSCYHQANSLHQKPHHDSINSPNQWSLFTTSPNLIHPGKGILYMYIHGDDSVVQVITVYTLLCFWLLRDRRRNAMCSHGWI